MTDQRTSDMPQIAVDTNIIPNDSIDCGIFGLRWCRTPFCMKQARLINFLIILTGSGLWQGACLSYFRISLQFVAQEYGWSSLLTDGLIASSGLFQALFAIEYTYWALKRKPTSWLGATFMLQAIAIVIAIIPPLTTTTQGLGSIYQAPTPALCTNTLMATQKMATTNNGLMVAQLVLLFVLQFALGLTSMSYITVGLSYLDDNSSSVNSPAAIALALAGLLFGNEAGGTLIMTLFQYNLKWWLGWIFLALMIFLHGFFLSLFPKSLPKTVVHEAAQRIVEETRSRQFGSQLSTYMDDPDLWPSLKRLFSNKALILQICSLSVLFAAYWNYVNQEQSYLRSRFFIGVSDSDGWSQEWRVNYIVWFLRTPSMAIGMLLVGLVISKFKFTARKMVFTAMLLVFFKAGVYVSFIFDSCNIGPIAGVANGKLLPPFCSNDCICSNQNFMPVCPENSTLTFYSPCFAGCKKLTTINGVNIYENCSCGNGIDYKLPQSSRAIEGSCHKSQCQASVIVFQVGVLGIAFSMGSVFLMKILVIMRSVLPQDKGLALGLLLTFGAFITYVPINILYEMISKLSCAVWSADGSTCLLLQTPKHGNILNIITAALSILAILFDIYVFFKVKTLNMYNVKPRDNNSSYTLLPNEERRYEPLRTPAAEAVNDTIVTSPVPAKINTPTTIRPSRPKMPRSEITVFRKASSLTNASNTSDNSNQSILNPGVKYSQVVFPPDKHKVEDGTTSPKRLAVRANVPVQLLTDNDVRTQLQSLKSFKTQQQAVTSQDTQKNQPTGRKPSSETDL